MAGKQDKIDDLAAIEAGAAAGATAVQPSDLTDYAKTADVTSALADKQDKLTFDTTPTEGSSNPVTSAGIKAAIAQAQLDGDVDLTDYPTKTEMNTALDGKQDTIDDLADIRSGAAAGATAVQPSDLAEYAKTADIPEQVNSDWNATSGVAQILNKPDLTQYATTSDLADKQNTLTEAQLAAVNSGVTSTTVAQVAANKDAIAIQDQMLQTKANTADLATVATSGDYADLANKPEIPEAQVNSDWNETDANAKSFILNKPDLANYVVKPEVPSTPGDYLLKVNNEGETPTYSWVDATEYDNASGGGSTDPTGPNFDWDDSGWEDEGS